MTAPGHYSVPGAPPCRCPWCKHEQVQPPPPRAETVQPEPLPVGAPLRILRLVDRWLAEDAVAELADWLAQDVH